MEPDPGARGRLGIAPALSVESQGGEWQTISFPFFDNNANGTFKRLIPAKTIQLADGTKRLAATVYDLMLSQYGIGRADSELDADGYKDADSFYTPAWQEKSRV